MITLNIGMKNNSIDFDELYKLFKYPPKKDEWDKFLCCIDVSKITWSDCWEWLGLRNKANYGVFHAYWNGKRSTKGSHRVISLWLYGELGRSLVIDHIKCTNPPCPISKLIYVLDLIKII